MRKANLNILAAIKDANDGRKINSKNSLSSFFKDLSGKGQFNQPFTDLSQIHTWHCEERVLFEQNL